MMIMPDSYNTVTIDLANLQKNFLSISRVVGEQVRVLAMVKSDAYGHGLVASAQALSAVGGDFFGVAEVDEGVLLREAGVPGEIVVFLGSRHCQEILDYRLTPVVFDLENIRAFSECAALRGTQIGVHLKIDSGMGRLGVMPAEAPALVKAIADLPGVFLAGIMSHFPMSDHADAAATLAQNKKFGQISQQLLALGGSGPAAGGMLHIANSAAALRFAATYFNVVRPGIALYGCYPSLAGDCRDAVDLLPVMSFSTRVVQIKEVPAGYGLSYGHLYVTQRPSRLAILPVGYADGYLRCLTGKAEVLIRGRRAPVCGRICMNATVVDVTDIPEVRVHEEVVLMGSSQENDPEKSGMIRDAISADEIAGWMDTISYEVLCLFGNSNQRVYKTNEV